MECFLQALKYIKKNDKVVGLHVKNKSNKNDSIELIEKEFNIICSNCGIYDFSINYEDCEDIKNNDKTYNYGNYNKYISDKIIKNINLVLD